MNETYDSTPINNSKDDDFDPLNLKSLTKDSINPDTRTTIRVYSIKNINDIKEIIDSELHIDNKNMIIGFSSITEIPIIPNIDYYIQLCSCGNCFMHKKFGTMSGGYAWGLSSIFLLYSEEKEANSICQKQATFPI